MFPAWLTVSADAPVPASDNNPAAPKAGNALRLGLRFEVCSVFNIATDLTRKIAPD